MIIGRLGYNLDVSSIASVLLIVPDKLKWGDSPNRPIAEEEVMVAFSG